MMLVTWHFSFSPMNVSILHFKGKYGARSGSRFTCYSHCYVIKCPLMMGIVRQHQGTLCFMTSYFISFTSACLNVVKTILLRSNIFTTRRVDRNADFLSHPFLLFHANWASYSRDTIWPWKFKVKGKGQRYPSQRSIQLTHCLSVSHQGILSNPVPFVPWQSGLPFSRYNLTLKIQGQSSRSNVKVK